MAKNNHDLTLSRLQQQTLHLLESPPEKRSPEEINNILHWIQNRTQVLKEVETGKVYLTLKFSILHWLQVEKCSVQFKTSLLVCKFLHIGFVKVFCFISFFLK